MKLAREVSVIAGVRLRGDAGLLERARKEGSVRERVVAEAIGEVLRRSGDGCASDPESNLSAQAIGEAYQSLLMLRPRITPAGELELKPARGTARKKLGAYYTPRWLVEHVLGTALDPVLRGLTAEQVLAVRVLDPACGTGNFLLAAADRLAGALALARTRKPGEGDRLRALREVGECLYGMDVDGVAVEICRSALRAHCGCDAGHIFCRDGLSGASPLDGRIDVVIGNPPFLNRLEKHTAVGREEAERLKERFAGGARAYTDVSALFLLRAMQLTGAGGRVALVQPQSLLSSRDAAGVREEVMRLGMLTDLWLADERTFDASVFVCVPTLEVGRRSVRRVRRRVGRGLDHVAPARIEDLTAWGPLAAWDVPEIDVRGACTIGDSADVAADFRDEYYGLLGCIKEDRRVSRSQRARFPALITTGLVEPAACDWGQTSCRFAGEIWDAPRVNLARLRKDRKLSAWADARLRPKLLLATQTRVLEVAVDAKGEWLPVTPLISIVPRKKQDLWLIAAALSSPVLAAIAARLSAGTALTRHAIKLSATQVRGLPLPAPKGDWTKAGSLFKQATRAGRDDRNRLLVECGGAMCRAYGLSAGNTKKVMNWWMPRLGATS